jgi:hypothetical protein
MFNEKTGFKNNQNKSDNLVIVGDVFQQFNDLNGFSTVNEFLSNEDKILTHNRKLEISIGQCVSFSEILRIKELISGNNNLYFDDDYEKKYFECTRKYTHKRLRKNVLISDPKSVDEKYTCYLLIDEYCSEMSDHITGFHLQGSLLLESSRQMTNAVNEKFILKDKSSQYGFILNSMQSKFIKYLFPIKTVMKYSVLKKRLGFEFNKNETAKIEFFQNNKLCAEIIIDFSISSKQYISNYEVKMLENISEQLSN